MHKRISLIAGLTALFAMGSAQAQVVVACPTTPTLINSDTNFETGHFYEVYAACNISWEAAKAYADAKTNTAYPDVKGHLATITSSKEDVFVDNLRRAAALREVWVGGSQTNPSAPRGDTWIWENKEGAIPTPQQPGFGGYQNWLKGGTGNSDDDEPNDRGGPESHLAIGLGNAFGWNDERYLPNIQGFIVEYDFPRTAACNINDTSCNTVDGQKLVFPAGSIGPGDTIGFNSFLVTDPRVDLGTCGTAPLTIFKEADGFEPNVELRIPAYLCGSPDFLVVKVDSTDLDIRQGAVGVINDTQVVLPDNDFRCFDPLVPQIPGATPPYSADPEKQDVVVWQSTDPSQMLEGPAPVIPGNVVPNKGATEGSVYFGTATEATDSCGSTKGLVRTGSYFVVGMHVEFVDGTDYTNFFNLTKYKMDLLMQSVRSARNAGAVRNPDGQAMESQLKNAITAMNANNPASALASIDKFLLKVRASQYLFPNDVTAKYNFQGDHLMRGENIQFTLRVKVIPFKP